jgi:hypothetical protein
MPDYSKIQIYKIQHIEDETLIYVGSTLSFASRKAQHKSTCNNPLSKSYNNKIYQMIRRNGNWDAFNMVIIQTAEKCNTKQDALSLEDTIMRKYKANLNTNRAYITDEEIIENSKIYRDTHREEIKKYRDNHKEGMSLYQKKYNETKEKCLLCGVMAGISRMKRHQLTYKCMNNIK